MRVLVTGFPPFPGVSTNPSQTLIDALRIGLLQIDGVEIIPATVPVEYQGVEEVFDQLLVDVQPDVVLSFGVGRHSHSLRFESLAVNQDDASIPDNAGEIRTESRIIKTGPEQIATQFDLDTLFKLLSSQGIPAEISQNAGRYVCNHLLYYGSYYQDRSNHPYQFLFTHLPSMENGFVLERTITGLETIINWFRIQLLN